MAHPYHMHREHQVSHRRVGPMLKEEPAGAKQHNDSRAFSKVTSKTAAESHGDGLSGKSAPSRYARGGKVKKADGGSVNRAAKGDAIASKKSPDRYGDNYKPYEPGDEDNEGGYSANREYGRRSPSPGDGETVVGKGRYARGGRTKHKGNQTNIAIVMPHRPATPPTPPAGPTGGPPPGGPPPLPPGMPPPGAGPGGPGMPMPPMHKRGGKVIDGESTKADISQWGKRASKNSYFRGGAATGVGREEKAQHQKRK